MNRFVTAALIALYPAALLLGVFAEKTIAAENAQKSWDGIMVIQNGTLVANPAALSPAELSNVQIVDPFDHITLTTCDGGHTVVNADCPTPSDWREIRSAASLRR